MRAPRSICAAARANRFLPPQKGSHPAWRDKKAPARGAFGTPSENRTHNCPLGGGRYIHLTMEANYFDLIKPSRRVADRALSNVRARECT